MKNSTFITLCCVVVLFSSCLKDTVKDHYSFFRPVYQTKESVKSGIRNSPAEQVSKPGKIVVKGNHLFLNDVDKGVHIIDITNLSKPVNIGFIHIPGCVDLAVNGDYLFADCYTDMVTIDISNPQQIAVKQFLTGVFPYRYYGAFRADTSLVIQKWVKVDTVVSHRLTNGSGNNRMEFVNGGIFFANSFASSSFSGTSSIGMAGSTSRFGQLNDRLYTVSNSDLNVFNVSTPSSPRFVRKVQLNQGNIETIFPYQSNLFIGAMGGMSIYSAANPDQPTPLGMFTHARSCDPVVADGQYAYVTLWGGGGCGGFSNQLDVLDVKDLMRPALVKTYPLTSPKGLSKDGNNLLICDGNGNEGVKIFNAADPAGLKLVSTVGGFTAHDVIAANGHAIVVARQGIFIIDYTNTTAPVILSKITIQEN